MSSRLIDLFTGTGRVLDGRMCVGTEVRDSVCWVGSGVIVVGFGSVSGADGLTNAIVCDSVRGRNMRALFRCNSALV